MELNSLNATLSGTAVGPMVQTWTIRHEAKLNFFKQASHLVNFKNVAHTLANRHQRWICYALASGRLVSSPLECGPSGTSGLTHVREETQDIQDKLFHIVPKLNMDASIFRPRWVRRNGILYQCNSLLRQMA